MRLPWCLSVVSRNLPSLLLLLGGVLVLAERDFNVNDSQVSNIPTHVGHLKTNLDSFD